VRQRNLAAALPGLIVGIVVVGGIFLLGLWWLNLATEPEKTHAPAPVETVVVNEDPALPPCATEDSEDCVWDAATQGDGSGLSFIRWHGQTYYLDGQQRDFVTINGTPMPGHFSSMNDDEPYVLMCELPLTIGVDTDDNGNQWAGCM
jgi:hypothetical protein